MLVSNGILITKLLYLIKSLVSRDQSGERVNEDWSYRNTGNGAPKRSSPLTHKRDAHKNTASRSGSVRLCNSQETNPDFFLFRRSRDIVH